MIKRTTPYPLGRKQKDKQHACYVITVDNITIKISTQETYPKPDLKIECDPSNVVNPPAIQYFKWNDNTLKQIMLTLEDVLNFNYEEIKHATKKQLKIIEKDVKEVLSKIAKNTKTK